jgi:LPXTG-site transpeptidase (sortase) family protein
MSDKHGISLPGKAERACYGLGVVLGGFFLAQIVLGESQRGADIARFEGMTGQQDTRAEQNASFRVADVGEPDTSLWAPGRIADYAASREAELPPVLGVLEIPSVGLRVPVYPSDTELNMNRGAGTIDGMAYPHEPGNIGIAGHRDGYFRVLKDVRAGDPLVLQTLAGTRYFRIEFTRVVDTTDTQLLQDTDDLRVTLVTCYPFYFVGHAPQRFIVTALPDPTYVKLN